MALKGHLQHFGLGELFQTLANHRHTGTLYVASKSEKKTIYFSTGSIAFLASGDGTVRLGEILRRSGRITDEQLEAATDEQVNSDKQIGRILLEQGVIDQGDLQFALQTKFEEELFELLLWDEGDFEFVPDFCPPDLLEPMQRYTQVRVDPQSIILEGLRQLDESQIIRSRLPDPRIWVERSVSQLPLDADLSTYEKMIWDLCDPSRSVAQIQQDSPETKFRTLKSLYRFIEEGWLHPLSFGELLQVARQLRRHNQREDALELYRFLRDWAAPGSQDPAFLDEAGRFLIEFGKKREASETLLKAFESHRRAGDLSSAWEVGRVLRDLSASDLDFLQRLWTVRTAASPRAVVELRRELLTALKREGRFQDAEVLLTEIESLEADRSEYWISRSEIALQLGHRDRAVMNLENAGQIAARSDDRQGSIQIAQRLYELDPKIPGIRSRIDQLLQKEAGARRRKRLRQIYLGIAALILVILAVPTIRYEARARTIYQKGLSLQTANAKTHELKLAHQQLLQVIEQYRFSTVAGASREALERVQNRIEELTSNERALAIEQARKDRESRLARDLQIKGVLNRSETEIQAGRYEESRAMLQKLLEELDSDLSAAQRAQIRYPLLIETQPTGATVSINGEKRGITPYLYKMPPGAEKLTIELARRGCEPLVHLHSDNGRAKLQYSLPRAPLATGALPGGIDRPVSRLPHHFAVPCRDGYVYLLAADEGATGRAQRTSIGIAGHPSAQLVTTGNLLITAAFDGHVNCLNDRTWENEWQIRLDSPILSATAVDRTSVAIGDESGRVHLINILTGQVVARTPPGFPIELIEERGGVLITSDRASRVQIHELPGLELLEMQSMSLPVAEILPNGAILLTDGTVRGAETTQRWPAPLTRIRHHDEQMYYGSKDGQWVNVKDHELYTYPAPAPLTCPPMVTSDSIYLADVEGRIHSLAQSEKTIQWSIEVDSPAADLRTTEDGLILAFLRSGKLLLLEGTSP